MDKASFTTSFSSTSILLPMPVHSGQAPNGLLKENILGSSFVMEKEHLGQESFSENRVSDFFPVSCIMTMPSPIFTASSTDCVSRFLSDFETASRSTTISTVCFLFLSMFILSRSEGAHV